MSALTVAHVLHEAPAFLTRLGQRFSAMLDGVAEARDMAERFKTLSRLSDEELAKRGITRDQIPQAVLDSRRFA